MAIAMTKDFESFIGHIGFRSGGSTKPEWESIE